MTKFTVKDLNRIVLDTIHRPPPKKDGTPSPPPDLKSAKVLANLKKANQTIRARRSPQL